MAVGVYVVVLLSVAAVAFVASRVLFKPKLVVPKGAHLAPKVRSRFVGIDVLVNGAVAAIKHREIEQVNALMDSVEGKTARAKFLWMDHAVMFSSDPEVIMHITAKNFYNWEKGPSFVDAFAELLGEGIFNSNGDQWKLHRDIARPHFVRDELVGYVEAFNEHFSDVEEVLERACKSGESIDMFDVFQRFTMDSFVSIFFGHELNSLRKPSEFAVHFDYLQSVASWRSRLDPFWKLLPRKTARMTKAIEYVDGFITKLIDEARHDKNLAERTDLLAHYLKSTDQNGLPFTDKYLRDMLVNFLLAGRDTTAALLTWTSYVLSEHPDHEQKVVDEITNVVGLDRFPAATDINELRYCKLVLNEVLRLYPSVPFNVRTNVADDVLPGGEFVPAGTDMFILTHRMQHDKELWGPTAEEFDPERYQHMNAKYPTNPCAFLPFHAGPRICLGQNMALNEARVALARLYQKYHLRHDPTNEVRFKTDIILTAANGMRMFVDRRL